MSLCKETMIRSYSNISFSPERRGEQDYNYYTELLENDLKELGENKGNYKEKFIDKVMDIYHKQSNCASSFIVGPANYNLGRHNKSWKSRDKAYERFEYWRKKYFKAVNRVRTLSPEAEIDKTIKELDNLVERKEVYKQARKLKSREEIENFLKENYKLSQMEKDLLEYGCGNIPSFAISSLTTKIRERKKKIEVMKQRIKRKEDFKPIKFKGGEIIIDNDRVIIKHDEKPDREIIQAIKSNGFRYSPKFKSWVRKHTGNAIYSVNLLLNNHLGGEV